MHSCIPHPPHPSDGSNVSTPVGSKSLTLRVTTVKPCSSAVAAIIRSGVSVPKFRRQTSPKLRYWQVDIEGKHTVTKLCREPLGHAIAVSSLRANGAIVTFLP